MSSPGVAAVVITNSAPVVSSVGPSQPVNTSVAADTAPVSVSITDAVVVTSVVDGPVAPATAPPAVPLFFDLSAVSTWSVAHGLTYDPDVQVIEAGRRVLIDVDYPDNYHVHISFPTPFTGKIGLR